MLPVGLFASRAFTVANLATVAVYGGLSAATFFIALFVQQVAGYGAFAAGLTLTPVWLFLITLSRRFGALADRLGPRGLMSLGPLLGAAGLLLVSRIGPDVRYASDLLPGVLLYGLGLSMTVAPLTATVLGAVEQRHAGVASGVNNALARVAGLVAIAAVGAVVAFGFRATLDARLAGERLSAGAGTTLAELRARPLAVVDLRELPPGERARVAPALEAASVSGFRWGIVVSALLMASGGLVSFVGLRGPRGRQRTAPVRVA